MHLLVLSAFRQANPRCRGVVVQGVSMHLLMLSAFRLGARMLAHDLWGGLNAPSGAQCFPTVTSLSSCATNAGLNAPSGAQCFPTGTATTRWSSCKSQCTFWCSVLSDAHMSRRSGCTENLGSLNAPSGAQCFPTNSPTLDAFRPSSLNAPSGAQCFPTDISSLGVRTDALGLNAPSGAQCFPTT